LSLGLIAESAGKNGRACNPHPGVRAYQDLITISCRPLWNAVCCQNNETFGEELEADLLAEGEKLGPVEKITVFAKNNKGPVVIKVSRRLTARLSCPLTSGRVRVERTQMILSCSGGADLSEALGEK